MSKYKTLFFLTALSAINTGFAKPIPLNIYAEEFFAAEWGPGQEVKNLFEQAHSQCQVNYVPFDSRTTMLNRIRLEGAKTKADVVVGLDNHQLEAAQKSGLFAKNNINLTALSLPVEWKNQTFLPYDFGQYAFVYDKTKLQNPPKSLKELIERTDLRVIYQDPRTSSVGRGLIVWVNSVYPPEQVEQVWQQLAKHTVTVGKGWSESYGAFLKGEADLVLSYNTSPIYHLLNEQKDQYAATDFEEGAVLQIETAAKIAGRDNLCADEFLQFLISPAAQKVIVPKNVMLSVIDTPIETHFDVLKTKQMQTRTIDTSSLNDERLKQWIEVWQAALTK